MGAGDPTICDEKRGGAGRSGAVRRGGGRSPLVHGARRDHAGIVGAAPGGLPWGLAGDLRADTVTPDSGEGARVHRGGGAPIAAGRSGAVIPEQASVQSSAAVFASTPSDTRG